MKNILVALFAIVLTVGLVSANTPEEIRDIISQEAVSTKLGKLEALCLKNSEDPEAFNNLGKATEEAKFCLETEAKLDEVVNNAVAFEDNDHNATFILKSYCSGSRAVNTCLNNWVEKAKICLNDTLEALLSIGVTLFKIEDHYLCTEGNQIAEFIDEDGISCIVNYSLPILECLDKTIQSYKFSGFGMSLQECHLIKNIKNCYVTTMTSDNCAKAVELIENFYKTANANSICAGKISEEILANEV